MHRYLGYRVSKLIILHQFCRILFLLFLLSLNLVTHEPSLSYQLPSVVCLLRFKARRFRITVSVTFWISGKRRTRKTDFLTTSIYLPEALISDLIVYTLRALCSFLRKYLSHLTVETIVYSHATDISTCSSTKFGYCWI